MNALGEYYDVAFEHGGKWYRFSAENLGDWYDVDAVMDAANRALEDAGVLERFHSIVTGGQDALLVLAKPESLDGAARELSLPTEGDAESARSWGRRSRRRSSSASVPRVSESASMEGIISRPMSRWHRHRRRVHRVREAVNSAASPLERARLHRLRALASFPSLRASHERNVRALRRVAGDPWRSTIEALESVLAADAGNVEVLRGLAVLRAATEALTSMAADPSENAIATLLVLLEYEGQIATRPEIPWKRLDLSFHRFQTLPAEVALLTDVQELDLNGCDLAEIPDELGRMQCLEALHLQGNHLDSIPDAIGELRDLQFLDLSHNRLRELPGGLSRLGSLQRLYLVGNRFEALPRPVRAHWALRILDVSNNFLGAIPYWIRELEYLEVLEANDNSLEELPHQIGWLPDLRTLQLNRNRIAHLPREIGLLSRLEDLGLAENRLRSLPASIGKLGSLLHLYLQRNHLTALPPEVAALPRLEALFVRGNPLPRALPLPRSLGRLVRTFPHDLGWQPSVQSG